MASHVSKSSIGMLFRCEQQWVYRYVFGKKSPPTAALTIGSAFHDGTNTNFQQKTTTRRDLPVDQVVEAAVHGLERRKDETEWAGKNEYTEAVDMMPRIVRRYQEDQAATIQPAFVELEKRVTLRAPDGNTVDLLGYIDVVSEEEGENGRRRIYDIKTAGRAWSEAKVTTALDPALYTIDEPGTSTFTFHVAVKKKTPKVQHLVTRVTPAAKASAQFKVIAAKKKMDELRADPERAVPTGYGGNLCSRRWCAYWAECEKRWRHTVPE